MKKIKWLLFMKASVRINPADDKGFSRGRNETRRVLLEN